MLLHSGPEIGKGRVEIRGPLEIEQIIGALTEEARQALAVAVGGVHRLHRVVEMLAHLVDDLVGHGMTGPAVKGTLVGKGGQHQGERTDVSLEHLDIIEEIDVTVVVEIGQGFTEIAHGAEDLELTEIIGPGLAADGERVPIRHHPAQDPHHLGIEASAGGLAGHDVQGLVAAHGLLVGPPRHQGLEDIGGRGDPHQNAKLTGAQPIGITAAVQTLMVVADNEDHARVVMALAKEVGPEQGMQAHDVPVLGGEMAGFEQDIVRNGDLADIVDKAGLFENFGLLGGEA